MPDSEIEMKKIRRKWFQKYKFLIHSSRISCEKTDSIVSNIARLLAFKIATRFDMKLLVDKMNEAFNKMNSHKTDHVGIGWWKKGMVG